MSNPLIALVTLRLLAPTELQMIESGVEAALNDALCLADVAVVDEPPPAVPSFLPYAFAVNGAVGAREVSPTASVGIEIPVGERVSLFRALSLATGKAHHVRAIPVPATEGAVVGVKLAF
jgi:hypothetical protein